MFPLFLASALATAQPSTDECAVSPEIAKLVPHATYCNTDRPPERFQHKEVSVMVTFKPTLLQVNLACNGGKLPDYGLILACTGKNIFGQVGMIFPDPCSVENDGYATLVCHELGHANGWPIYHGD